jgi:hypothetical protein
MPTPNVIASVELQYIILWATSVPAFCHMLQIYPWVLIRWQRQHKDVAISLKKQQSNVLFLEGKDSIVFSFVVSCGLIIDSLGSLI